MNAHQNELRAVRRAFSLVEVLVVIVVLGILAAVAIPQFVGVTDDARTSSLQSTLSGVRSSIASFRTTAVINGDDPYPTIGELTTPDTVLKFELPANPFTGIAGVQSVSSAQAAARAVSNPGTYGWNYFVDNADDPPTAVFYANSDATTTATDGSGGVATANNL